MDNVQPSHGNGALFSGSTGRVLVSVGREDYLMFVGLCEACGISAYRIGVSSHPFTRQLNDLRGARYGNLRELID